MEGQKYVKMQSKIDAVKLASVTTWVPTQAQTSPDNLTYAYDSADFATLDDRIDFVFNPTRWQDKKTNFIHVGIYAADEALQSSS